MSAQHRSFFTRLNVFRFVDWLLEKTPTPQQDSGWQRSRPALPARAEPAPVPLFGGPPVKAPPLAWTHHYRQSSQPLQMTPTPKQTHLSREARQEILATIPTQKQLRPEELAHVGMLTGNQELLARARQLQQRPEGWLNDVSAEAKRGPSGYLLASRPIEPPRPAWEDLTALAHKQTQDENDTPTLAVPSVMKQRVEQRYHKESE